MEENKENINWTTSSTTRMSGLLRAAEPFLTISMKSSMDLLIKAVDLSSALKELKTKKHFSDFSKKETANSDTVDFDGLLHSVRNYCSKNEQDMIDKIISMQSTMKMMKTFQDVMSVMSELNPDGNSSENVGESSAPDGEQSPFSNGMLETLEQMLPPEQKGMFETMKMLMSSGMLSNL